MVAPCLVLIGYRGAGKSVVGRTLAERMGLVFVDTDTAVEELLGRPVAELFAVGLGGVARFRRSEGRVIAGLDSSMPAVVATGGGAVEDAANRGHLRRLGAVVWLRAEVETLRFRIAGSGRPPLTAATSASDEVAAVLARREPLYGELAQWVVDTDNRSPEEICDELQQLWRGATDHNVR